MSIIELIDEYANTKVSAAMSAYRGSPYQEKDAHAIEIRKSIVRACNAHDELVLALRRLLAVPNSKIAAEMAQEALAKAGA
jgi:hypothetical protein